MQWSHAFAFVLGILLTVGAYEFLGVGEPDVVVQQVPLPPLARQVAAQNAPAEAPRDAKRPRQLRNGPASAPVKGRQTQARPARAMGPGAQLALKWFKELPQHEKELIKDSLDIYLDEVGVEGWRELTEDQRTEFKEITQELLAESREIEAAVSDDL